MGSSGYIDEAEFKSVYSHDDIDDTRFDYCNVKIGSLLNLALDYDAGTDFTDTEITPILKLLSEEALRRLLQASKGDDVVNPFDYIQTNVSRFASSVIRENGFIIALMKEAISKKHHVKYSNVLTLPSHSD